MSKINAPWMHREVYEDGGRTLVRDEIRNALGELISEDVNHEMAPIVAAAPEMLEALKLACDEIKSLREYANNHGAMYDDETFAEGLAVISRAEGSP